MASPSDPIILVGGGLASARAIEGIREEGDDRPIVLVGKEDVLPYDRPPLSKKVLLGDAPVPSSELHDEAWYAAHAAEPVLGTAVRRLDVVAQRVTLDNGRDLPWSALLLATGSSPRQLDLPGSTLDHVLTLRTAANAAELQSRLATGEPAAIIGAGWIGLEVAAAAREHGCTVTVIEPQATPLSGVLGPEVGRLIQRVHEDHGVTFHLGTSATEVLGDDHGAVRGIRLEDGTVVTATTVVVGIGITPDVQLAEEAGLLLDNGISCDERLRTSGPQVWAAGDVASWCHPRIGHRLRVDHWTNAFHSGYLAGRGIAGADVVHDRFPVFFSDQYDLGLEYVGHVPRGTSTDVVLRGDPASGAWLAFWLDGDRLLAGMHVNTWGAVDEITPLLGARGLDRERLADPGIPLAEVAERSAVHHEAQ
jgi:3-phenylpropionate/trans-cinnamate dioxygenase ferredoxin reductase subunit